jgi:tetratricopeptide (TPR) repeat protein
VRRSWLIAFIFLTAANLPAASQMVEEAESARLLELGRNHLFHHRIDAAEDAFRRLAARPDGKAASAYYRSLIALWDVLRLDVPAAYDAFQSWNGELEAAAAGERRTQWQHLFRAEGHLQRSVVHGKSGNNVRAALAARSAYGHYRAALRADPELIDALKGMGMLNVAIGSLPSGYRRLLSLFGYGGDVEGGFRQLARAAEAAPNMAEEATLLLSLLALTLGKKEYEPLQRVASLSARYPDSPIIGYLHAFLLLEDRQAANAERILRRYTRVPEAHYVDFVDYFLADALFRQEKFEEAARWYSRYLGRHQGSALKAFAHLNLGHALELSGRRSEAVAEYGRVSDGRDLDVGEVTRRLAERRLSAPLTKVEKSVLLGAAAYDSGRNAEAEKLFESVASRATAPSRDRAEAFYRLARVRQAEGRLGEAREAYRQAIRIQDHPEDRWAPWAHFYIGQTYDIEGRSEEARAAYRAALAHRGRFDYHRSLEQRARTALRGE